MSSPVWNPNANDKSALSWQEPVVDEHVVHQILQDQHVVVSNEEQNRFIDQLSRSLRKRQVNTRRWLKNRNDIDIIGLIQISSDSGDKDEAVWRAFLATHFGRDSTERPQIDSAAKLLCAFGVSPYWTWQRVSSYQSEFHKWLLDHASDFRTLAYGNHRKFESKKAKDFWVVANSFLALAAEFGSPLGIITIDKEEFIGSGEQFDLLYRRLKPLVRFGRTGCFDFLVLLSDLNLIIAQPTLCYLRGSTGPKKGATELWGKRRINELEQLAADSAKRAGVSPTALEDALCNWQKKAREGHGPRASAGHRA
jgi:hypothetical protein